MEDGIEVYCYICCAMPGEMCRSKYIVHGKDEVTPVICPPHSTRVVDGQRGLARLACQEVL
jgi:hypothetical protein